MAYLLQPVGAIEFGCVKEGEIEFVDATEPPALPRTIRLSPEDLPPDDEPIEDVRDE